MCCVLDVLGKRVRRYKDFMQTFEHEEVEKVATLDDRAISAKESEIEAENLIREFTPFLRGRVARYGARYDEHMREAIFSTAMSSFYEAIKSFDRDKGHFFPFANRVVCARIIDHIREINRHEGKTVSLDDEGDEEQRSAQSSVIAELSMRNYEAERRREALADEIEQFKTEIADWGITMESLAKASPKHKELRKTYYEAIAAITLDPDIMQTIRLKRYFPIKAVSNLTKIPQKKLERARTFIIASLIIRTGDYDHLAGFLEDGRSK